MKNGCFVTVLLWMMCSVFTPAQTVYFLVAHPDPGLRTDSYVLPLTDPEDIAHARDLIQYGTAAGQTIVVANIACGADNINRNFYSPSKNAWNWHVTEFLSFADFTIEIYDGNPVFVNNDCLMAGTTLGTIGFWSYTVVAELGENPKTWQGNLNSDSAVNMADMKIMSQYWDSYPCANPSWCGNADITMASLTSLTLNCLPTLG
jgi:hypothetical protein